MPPIPPKKPGKPDVRLAYNPGPVNTYKSIKRGDSKEERAEAAAESAKVEQEKAAPPSVRLATSITYGALSPDQFERALNKKEAPNPALRLALGGGQPMSGEAPTAEVKAAADPSTLPALLVSYYYLEQFEKNRHRYHYRDWVMDSGAFSAHNSGVEIKLQDYIDCCKNLMQTDPTMVEVYALDVIGDWKASLKNTEEMWSQGVPAIPCYHLNEPWSALIQMAKDYPKIALGGVAARTAKGKMEWAGQCFARVWPKPIHGFAFGSEKSILSLPFHSVDASSWELGPVKFGNWRAFKGQRVSVRGSSQNLRAEVEWYLELEQRARVKWKKEMLILEEMLDSSTIPPSLRFACVGNAQGEINGALADRDLRPNPVPRISGPTIRLAEGGTSTRGTVKAAAFNPSPKKDAVE